MNAHSRWRTPGLAAMMLLVPLLIAAPHVHTALADDKPVVAIAKGAPYADLITEAAQRFELSASWIRAVMPAESDGDPRATSPKGAMGLMQIMPETWIEIRVRHRLGSDPYDPHDNIIAGTAYIRELYDRYGSPGWIAAYNAGPSRYEASLKGRPLPPETLAYVASVAPNLDGRSDPNSVVMPAADLPSWSRAPLFIAQSKRRPDAVSAQKEHPSIDGPVTTAVRDVSAIVPQSGGLFVVRADSGRQP
ncbi:putative lytic transglycosylase [uncultured Pleomorphomonas sp.]|uniref:Putative lytic transglycosylase n=1 Tax=uncultured Pleomorphomonas sp. TaxID=442121 RepID=A0A212KXX0_9HYPH|nr:lytic transglycosylase domain-containing protein [uncultured Pleomorphomonas sp.]SCM70120.1 putative lytic transglycosylase [uncultured Pleomorphomonas sp.]